MQTTSGTVTVWQAGRLVPRHAPRGFEFDREQWLLAGLLVLSAIVMTLYVVVLERDVASGALQQASQRSRAIAEAQCEAGQPVQLRGRCSALFNADAVAVAAPAGPTPDAADYAQEDAARTATLSLLAAR